MSGKNTYPEMAHLPFDGLNSTVTEYTTAAQPYWTATYVNGVHDEEGFATISGQDLTDWRQRFPRNNDDTMAQLETQYNEARARLAQTLALESADLIDSLVAACMAQAVKRDMEPKPWWPGLVVPGGKTHGWFAEGVLTMAKLTGEPYKIHNKDIDSGYYVVSPTDSLSDIFSELK